MNKQNNNKDYKICEIIENKRIGDGINKITLSGTIDHEPGQFVMLWLPNIGEKPFVPIKTNKEISFIVKEKGKFTKAICQAKKKEFVGVRGPLGKGFSYKGIKRALLVAGGIGIVPLTRLAEELHKEKIKFDLIIGAKTQSQLIKNLEIEKNAESTKYCTDDGSCGMKGTSIDLFIETIKKNEYDKVYVCGPERMMKAALDICIKNKLEAEFSLERYFKCGIGICGQCAIDGLLVCKDGPVFNAKQLVNSREFGQFAYDKAGKKITIEEFYKW